MTGNKDNNKSTIFLRDWWSIGERKFNEAKQAIDEKVAEIKKEASPFFATIVGLFDSSKNEKKDVETKDAATQTNNAIAITKSTAYGLVTAKNPAPAQQSINYSSNGTNSTKIANVTFQSDQSPQSSPPKAAAAAALPGANSPSSNIRGASRRGASLKSAAGRDSRSSSRRVSHLIPRPSDCSSVRPNGQESLFSQRARAQAEFSHRSSPHYQSSSPQNPMSSARAHSCQQFAKRVEQGNDVTMVRGHQNHAASFYDLNGKMLLEGSHKGRPHGKDLLKRLFDKLQHSREGIGRDR